MVHRRAALILSYGRYAQLPHLTPFASCGVQGLPRQWKLEYEEVKKFRGMKKDESYFDKDEGDKEEEGPSPYFQHGNDKGGPSTPRDDVDVAFDMRLAALQAAS